MEKVEKTKSGSVIVLILNSEQSDSMVVWITEKTLITINGKSHILPYALPGQARIYFSYTYATPQNFADFPTMMKS